MLDRGKRGFFLAKYFGNLTSVLNVYEISIFLEILEKTRSSFVVCYKINGSNGMMFFKCLLSLQSKRRFDL